MKQKQTPYQQFEEEIVRRYGAYESDYNNKIGNALDDYKAGIHNGFLNAAREEYDMLLKSLKDYNRFIIDIKDECGVDKSKRFDILFNERYNSLPKEGKNIILEKHSQLRALDKLFGFLSKEQIKYPSLSSYASDYIPANAPTSIKWKGTTELEFVQLIYALHESGYLQNEQQEITTLVEEVAFAFNLKLGNFWQSNHSESIHGRDDDYESKIFQKLENAYMNYRETQMKKKNKKKISPK